MNFKGEKLKEKVFEATCNKCNQKFTYDSESSLRKSIVKNEHKQEMEVSFFVCLNCKEVTVVTILDKKAQMLMQELTTLVNRFQALNGRPAPRTLRRQIERAHEKYMEQQTSLKKRYEKHLYLTDEDGKPLAKKRANNSGKHGGILNVKRY